ncbi:MAG: hypothetical protein AAGA96_09780 [Verrucomicrobiota bacterium]
MSASIVKKPGRRDARRLQQAYDKAIIACLQPIRLGLIAIEIKGRLGHGEFIPWLKKHCPTVTRRTVSNAMRVARWMRGQMGNAFPISDLIDATEGAAGSRLANSMAELMDGRSQRDIIFAIRESQVTSEEEAEYRRKCKDVLCADDDDEESLDRFDDLEERVEAGELTWYRAWLGVKGRDATAGKQRGETQRDFWPEMAKNLNRTWHAFKQWDDVPDTVRVRARTEWRRTVERVPDDLLEETVKTLEKRLGARSI